MGLIFLSAMATSIAKLCEENGYDPNEALGTSLLTLAISTFIVGLLIVLVGKRLFCTPFNMLLTLVTCCLMPSHDAQRAHA